MFQRHARPKAGHDSGMLAVLDEAPEPEQLESAGAAETGYAPDEQPWWRRYGATEEEAAAQIANIDSLRGRQANELGELRRENDALRAQHDLGEDGGHTAAAPSLAVVLAEIETRFMTQLEALAGALANAVDARVAPIESKVDALIRRFVQQTRGGLDV